MAAFKIPEKVWKWAFSLAFFAFYLSSFMAILTNEGIYTQAGAALLGSIIVLYLIFSKER